MLGVGLDKPEVFYRDGCANLERGCSVSRANSPHLVPQLTHVKLSFTVLCCTSACNNINKNQAIHAIIFFSILKINGTGEQVDLKSSSYKMIILSHAVLLRLQKMTCMY